MTGANGGLALEGMRVLDCTQIMAGPFCTLLLADMGADVIKIERPEGGDDIRHTGPFIDGWSAPFLGVNRNKRSVALDLRSDAGREVFKRLLSSADVMVQNFRPGTLQRMGLSFSDLQPLRPELIYCSISGFGNTGPYSHRGGFDLVAQGMSGLMSFTGMPDGPPVKVGVPITDLNAGMYAAYGILTAYIHRLKTGKGQEVDASLIESGIAYTFWESASYFNTGQVPEPLGSAHRLSAPYQALRTSDGYMNLGAANQRTWEAFCRAVGLEDLLNDERFSTNTERKAREGELADLLEGTLRTQPTAYWVSLLEEAGVPAGPIYNLDQMYNDPHVRARNMVVELEDPRLGVIKHIGVPVKLSGTPGSIRHRAPDLGEHSREVLLETGFSSSEVENLVEHGTLRVPAEQAI